MEDLPKEVLSEVLACLLASEIASLVSCNRKLHSMVASMGCLSTDATFRKAVSISDLYEKYALHVLLGPAPGSVGAVTFRLPRIHYEASLARRLVLQSLTLVQEHDAARWLARSWGMQRPRLPGSSMSLHRNLLWDFALYTIMCNAVDLCRVAETFHLNIRSLPGLQEDGRRLAASSQAFLCNLLCNTRGKDVNLYLCGTHHDLPHEPVTRSVLDEERSRVDRVLQRSTWSDNIGVYAEHNFRSSTVSLGAVLATANPSLWGLTLSNYIFDEVRPSVDVLSLASYLIWGAHDLTRVNFHGLSFSSGDDLCELIRALCKVGTLETVRLSNIICLTEPSTDPLEILFEDGGHLKDLRLDNVSRGMGAVPFQTIPVPGYRCLGLKRMFLDTVSVRPLMLKLPLLPGLVSLDLSCNGIDGSILKLLSGALKQKTCSLQRLKLASNIITGVSVLCFCDALLANTSLLNLDLSDNFLGTHNGLTLLKAVLWNTSSPLRYVNLNCNQIRYAMSDLYRILLATPRKGPFRQVSLRSNPLQADDRDGVYKYTYFFKQEFNVSFNF